jgi:hypothetical protein
LDRQRRPRGTLGVVLVRKRIAEQRHQPVAELFGPQESDLCVLRRDALQSRPASRPLGDGRMAKELIRDVQGSKCAESSPDVVDPFLNLPGKGWNILDREDAHKGV